jgi:hypothetical protein
MSKLPTKLQLYDTWQIIPVDELPPFINLQILPHGFLPAAIGLVLVNS